MSDLTKFITSPETIPLVFAQVMLIFSWPFESLAAGTLQIDNQTIIALAGANASDEEKKNARLTILDYCNDMVWRVGLLTSVAASIIAILVLIPQSTTHNLSLWAMAILLLTMICTISFLIRKSNPYELSDPIIQVPPGHFLRHLQWLNAYRSGTIIIFVLNLVVIILNYLKFKP